MSCTCKYGSGRVCGFCEHRAQTNERLKKLEDAQASADYARGVAAERARVVAALEKRAWMLPKAERQALLSAVDRINRGLHDKGGRA